MVDSCHLQSGRQNRCRKLKGRHLKKQLRSALTEPAPQTLVLGIGNAWRGDDSAALLVARAMCACKLPDVTVIEASVVDPSLIAAWQDIDRLVVVDAAVSGAPPGTVHCFDLSREALPGSLLHRSAARLLYHRHVLDERGMIVAAQITPPTAQNQVTIEADLRALVEPRAHLPLNELTWQCEQAIRNYAPSISCSTHFLRVEIERM